MVLPAVTLLDSGGKQPRYCKELQKDNGKETRGERAEGKMNKCFAHYLYPRHVSDQALTVLHFFVKQGLHGHPLKLCMEQ